jgi:DNA-binding transcriptional LysR family regulator
LKYPYITVRRRLDNSFQVIETILALKDELGFVARSFTDTEMQRDVYMVYHKDKYLSAPVREFIEQARMAFR